MTKQMTTMKPFTYLLLPLCLLCSVGSKAQSLSLFEPLERSTDRGGSAPAAARPVPVQPVQNGQPGATFTLQGLARFGDEYRGTLRDSNGNTVRLSWREGEQVPLPGHAGYAVLGLAQDRLQLQQPQACFPDPAQGIACSAPNIASLALATRPPTAPVQEPQRNTRRPAPGSVSGASGQPMTVNQGQAVMLGADGNAVFFNSRNGEPVDPEQLQALLNARVQGLRGRLAGRRGQEVQTVEAESVFIQDTPAGMRVVRTPFGDRLVPDRN